MAYKKLSLRTWNKKVMVLALSYLSIRECKKCGSPNISGYCCYFCGDTNPSEKAIADKVND